MVDEERRKFLKFSALLISSSSTLAITNPLKILFDKKIKSELKINNETIEIPEGLEFKSSYLLEPQTFAYSALISFIMMYAESIEVLLYAFILFIIMLTAGISISTLQALFI